MTKTARQLLILFAALSLFAAACDSGARQAAGPTEDEGATEEASATEPSEATATEGAEGGATGGGDLSVGLITINLQARFFNQVNEGAQTVADETGADLDVFNANNDPVAQNDAMENFVAQDKDAIIVLAIDTQGIVPAIEAADDAGVPVVAVDAIVESDAVATQVGTDNEEAGRQIGEYLVKQAGEPAPVGVVGALNSTIQNVRQKGFEDVVTEAGFEIANVVDGRNIQEEALAASENLLTGNPNMAYAYATGEPALVGLVSAVQSQGAQDRVQVVGWDLTESVADAMREGWVIGVVQQSTFEFGEEGMRAAISLAQGEEVDDEIPIDVSIVTPDNLEDFEFYLED